MNSHQPVRDFLIALTFVGVVVLYGHAMSVQAEAQTNPPPVIHTVPLAGSVIRVGVPGRDPVIVYFDLVGRRWKITKLKEGWRLEIDEPGRELVTTIDSETILRVRAQLEALLPTAREWTIVPRETATDSEADELLAWLGAGQYAVVVKAGEVRVTALVPRVQLIATEPTLIEALRAAKAKAEQIE